MHDNLTVGDPTDLLKGVPTVCHAVLRIDSRTDMNGIAVDDGVFRVLEGQPWILHTTIPGGVVTGFSDIVSGCRGVTWESKKTRTKTAIGRRQTSARFLNR